MMAAPEAIPPKPLGANGVQCSGLTYLKLTGVKIGLLINFNVVMLKSGIRRLVH